MVYTPLTWVDGTTFANAANLNHLEDGVTAASVSQLTTVTGTGADQKTAIDNAIAAAVSTGSMNVLLRGAITTAGGHVVPEGVRITGLGQEATRITHTGNNDCFTCLTNSDFYKSPSWSGFTLVGNAGATASGIHTGNNYASLLTDLQIQDYTAGKGVWLENSIIYSEGVQLVRVHLANNAVNLKLSRSGTGTDSFSECRFYGLSIGMNAPNSIGIDFGAGTLLYAAALDVKIMTAATATGAVCINLSSTAIVRGSRGFFYIEGTVGTGIVAPAGSVFEIMGGVVSELNHTINGAAVSNGFASHEFIASGGPVTGTVTTGNAMWRQGRTPQDGRVIASVQQIDPSLRLYRWTGSAGIHYPWALTAGGTTGDLLEIKTGTSAVPGAESLTATVIGMTSTKIGFLGAAPVVRAAAIASPTSDTVGTKAAIDAIRVALANIGITL